MVATSLILTLMALSATSDETLKYSLKPSQAEQVTLQDLVKQSQKAQFENAVYARQLTTYQANQLEKLHAQYQETLEGAGQREFNRTPEPVVFVSLSHNNTIYDISQHPPCDENGNCKPFDLWDSGFLQNTIGSALARMQYHSAPCAFQSALNNQPQCNAMPASELAGRNCQQIRKITGGDCYADYVLKQRAFLKNQSKHYPVGKKRYNNPR